MKILKTATTLQATLNEQDLELINRYALKELTADDVFVFRMALCGNDIDRDFDAFPVETLKQMAPLFVGKPVLLDHFHSASVQTARIYKTEIAPVEGEYAKTGEPLTHLLGYCYIPRTEQHQATIENIENGILRECSVGCVIKSVTCAICGKKWLECKHQRGAEYDGELCYFKLEKPVDAYEVSFVAVPAQPDAGVRKKFEEEEPEEKEEPKMVSIFDRLKNKKFD